MDEGKIVKGGMTIFGEIVGGGVGNTWGKIVSEAGGIIGRGDWKCLGNTGGGLGNSCGNWDSIWSTSFLVLELRSLFY